MMRAILIDPAACQVSEVEGDFNELRVMYSFLHCDTIEAFRFPTTTDWVICDEEAKLKEVPAPLFRIAGFHDLICGRALVVGANEEGDNIEPATPLKQVQAMVRFLVPLSR